MGEALVTNPEISADYGSSSPTTSVARDDLTTVNGATDQVAPLQRNRAPLPSGIVSHFERN
jgi:hypothetical protein